MFTVLWVMYVGIFAITLVWIYRIAFSFIHLINERSKLAVAEGSQNKVEIHILLPVLNEDARLEEFTEYYLQSLLSRYPNLDLWIITTERESKEYPLSCTFERIKQIKKYSDKIHHLHSPYTTGTMAHQLNYGVDHMPKNGLYAIYNADSRPEPKTFEWITRHFTSGKVQVFQQYGIYTKNYSYINKQRFRSLLLANAIWQCRWSLGFEYYRAAAALKRKRLVWFWRPFNYCIGHGLFISSNLPEKIRFSESTTNEDAIFGIELAMNDINIQPIPFFDISESPDSVISVYYQKSNWFQGPFQAIRYFDVLKNKYPYKFKLAIVNMKLFSHALYWIAEPLTIVTAFVVSIILGVQYDTKFLFLTLIPISFLLMPAVFSIYVITKIEVMGHNGDEKYYLPKQVYDLIAGSIPAYIIHGLAGAKGALFSHAILHGIKKKTPMSQQGEV